MAIVTFEGFQKVEMRVGRIIAAEDFPEACNLSYKLRIDFGPHGVRKSSAAVQPWYPVNDLVGRPVVAVTNFPPRQIGLLCPRSFASGRSSRIAGSSCSAQTRRESSVLGSPDPHREFLIRACGILIHDLAVLAQEADDGRGGRSYALPGGHLEFGESLTECMSREIYEESGLNVEAEKLVYVHENFYSLKGVTTHEIGFYFLVDLNSEFPAPDPGGYIPSRERHIRMRLLPLGGLPSFTLMPPFLREDLPRDAHEHFVRPTRHLVSREV